MKAIITRDKGSPRRFGLRLVSEGANDVVMMELLAEEYPAIRTRDVRNGTMDMDVPILTADPDSAHVHASLVVAEQIRIAPGDLFGLGGRGAKTIVSKFSAVPRVDGLVIYGPGGSKSDIRRGAVAIAPNPDARGRERGAPVIAPGGVTANGVAIPAGRRYELVCALGRAFDAGAVLLENTLLQSEIVVDLEFHPAPPGCRLGECAGSMSAADDPDQAETEEGVTWIGIRGDDFGKSITWHATRSPIRLSGMSEVVSPEMLQTVCRSSIGRLQVLRTAQIAPNHASVCARCNLIASAPVSVPAT